MPGPVQPEDEQRWIPLENPRRQSFLQVCIRGGVKIHGWRSRWFSTIAIRYLELTIAWRISSNVRPVPRLVLGCVVVLGILFFSAVFASLQPLQEFIEPVDESYGQTRMVQAGQQPFPDRWMHNIPAYLGSLCCTRQCKCLFDKQRCTVSDNEKVNNAKERSRCVWGDPWRAAPTWRKRFCLCPKPCVRSSLMLSLAFKPRPALPTLPATNQVRNWLRNLPCIRNGCHKRWMMHIVFFQELVLHGHLSSSVCCLSAAPLHPPALAA